MQVIPCDTTGADRSLLLENPISSPFLFRGAGSLPANSAARIFCFSPPPGRTAPEGGFDSFLPNYPIKYTGTALFQVHFDTFLSRFFNCSIRSEFCKNKGLCTRKMNCIYHYNPQTSKKFYFFFLSLDFERKRWYN